MENLIRTRICELRKIMKESGIEIYIIPTGDYHQSEYISDYFKEREYITGFTGSAGTAVITEEERAYGRMEDILSRQRRNWKEPE